MNALIYFRYLLATCTFTPLYGRLCNVLGRKGANQVAMLFAGVGVLMCGLSTSMEMLIIARFVRSGSYDRNFVTEIRHGSSPVSVVEDYLPLLRELFRLIVYCDS